MFGFCGSALVLAGGGAHKDKYGAYSARPSDPLAGEEGLATLS